MIKLENISLDVGARGREQRLLHDISFAAAEGDLVAIVGASGSGKSTLLKLIAGMHEPSAGSIRWNGRDLVHEGDLAPSELGYVPQFSIAYEPLTVSESVSMALKLRVAGVNGAARDEKVVALLKEVGLEGIAERRVRVLSGGEKRRLALAMELVSDPALLLCDEVTSGLDPKSEEDVIELLRHLSQTDRRTVLSVTHSLRHFSSYDKVAVLHAGRLVYFGRPGDVLSYFGVHDPEEIYGVLAQHEPKDLEARWREHLPGEKEGREEKIQPRALHDTPGFLTQLGVLWTRRWKIMFRQPGQMGLQLGLILGFPLVVVLFALDGLPQIRNLSMSLDVGLLQQLKETNDYILQSTKAGSLVSGLVMFQVILLTLMGSNNSSREVTGERSIFEKEKLGGLRASSYLVSKVLYLSVLVLVQSWWMAVFVKTMCQFPGDFLAQFTMLFLVNASLTAICLGVSSLMKTSEQSSLVSVYFVGFQLPLSGAILALPTSLEWLTRPSIAAYWSWSGYIQSMRDTRFYDVIRDVSQTELSSLFLCYWVLGSHIILGLFVAYLGCKRSQWD